MIPTHLSHRWSWRIRYRPRPRIRSAPKQFDWWILRYCLLGSKGRWFYDVSLHPSASPGSRLLTSRSSPGLINCFNSDEEYIKFWNGTVVYPRIDIKYGFSDPSDLQYFNSQVDVMDARWKAFGDLCLKHETGQYLPYVGTTATVRDLVAIAEYFDGKDSDINYYGFSYGTTIGNYLINSKLAIPPSPALILTLSSQCSPTVLARSSWMVWRTPSLTLLSPLTSPGHIVLSPSTKLSRVSLRDAPLPVPTDALSPPILPQDLASSSGLRTCSRYAHPFIILRHQFTSQTDRPRLR